MQAENKQRRLFLFTIFIVFGLLVFAVPLLSSDAIALSSRIIICVFFFTAAIILRRTETLSMYFPVFFAFAIASTVSLFEYGLYANQAMLYWISSSRMDLTVVFKVLSAAIVVTIVILSTKASGQNLSSLYLSKGNLRLGLIIGIATFLFFLVTSPFASTLLYAGKDVTFEKLVAWAPWVLVFVFVNGVKEELQFRGLFLKKYEEFLGKKLANVLQAMIFVFPHFGETYSTVMIGFLLIVFLLGLAFGAVMQKTSSLIGSAIFHAGTDIPVILGIFSNF